MKLIILKYSGNTTIMYLLWNFLITDTPFSNSQDNKIDSFNCLHEHFSLQWCFQTLHWNRNPVWGIIILMRRTFTIIAGVTSPLKSRSCLLPFFFFVSLWLFFISFLQYLLCSSVVIGTMPIINDLEQRCMTSCGPLGMWSTWNHQLKAITWNITSTSVRACGSTEKNHFKFVVWECNRQKECICL